MEKCSLTGVCKKCAELEARIAELESDIEDELREDFVGQVRDEF